MVCVLAACAGHRSPAETSFATLHEPDRGELVVAARRALDFPNQPDAHVALATRCLRAGTEQLCASFYQAQLPRSIGPALLALAFGDPQQLLLRINQPPPEDNSDTRFVGAVMLARHFASAGKPEEAARMLSIADQEPAALERQVDASLARISVAIEQRDFATAHGQVRSLVESEARLDTEQRELLLRLGSRLKDRASLADDEASDAARRLLANLTKLSAEEATQEADVALSRHPNSSLVWSAAGLARLKAGQESSAVLALERAHELDAFDPEPDWQLAQLHERRQRLARAVFHLRRALDSSPTFANALWRLCDVGLLAKDLAAADIAMRRLKRLYPEELRVDLGRARVLLEGDDAFRAIAVLKESTRQHPTDVRAPLALAKAALTLRERATTDAQRKAMLSEATRAYEIAKGIDEAHGEVQALDKALSALKGVP